MLGKESIGGREHVGRRQVASIEVSHLRNSMKVVRRVLPASSRCAPAGEANRAETESPPPTCRRRRNSASRDTYRLPVRTSGRPTSCCGRRIVRCWRTAALLRSRSAAASCGRGSGSCSECPAARAAATSSGLMRVRVAVRHLPERRRPVVAAARRAPQHQRHRRSRPLAPRRPASHGRLLLLLVVLQPEMRDLFLTHQMPKRVLELRLLDEKIMFRLESGSGHRRFVIEA